MTCRVMTAENGLVHMSTLTTNAPCPLSPAFSFPLDVDNVGYWFVLALLVHNVTANG